jgi:FkbM family methyltransferase
MVGLGRLGRALEILRTEGPISLARKSYPLIVPPLHTTVEVSGYSASFLVSSTTELYRFDSLMGEREVLQTLLDDLRDGDVFYDVGANVGLYSVLAATAASDVTVVAFEPHPTNADVLRRNAALNGQDPIVMELALLNESSEDRLEEVNDGEAGEGKHRLTSTDAPSTLAIRSERADSLRESGEIPAPDVVKIDVEGAEQRVLEGMASTLASDPPRTIYCEIHRERVQSYDGDAEEIRHLLRSHGYDLEVLEDRDTQQFVRATR